VHAAADVQDTPDSEAVAAPFGLGIASIAHFFPFQPSASGPSPPPTAVHAVADVQDTAVRELTCDPFGLGVGWTAQLFPFHASTRVASRPVLL
jgi:hypothetical protein